MFQLSTEYFVWDFLSWAVNFLLAALLIFIAVAAAWRTRERFFAGSGERAGGEGDLSVSECARYPRLIREEIFECWLRLHWPGILAPFFFLALFLIAVYAR